MKLPLWRRRLLLERLRILNAAKKALKPVPPQDPPYLTFWRRPGLWITRIDHFPAEYLPIYARGYGYVVIPCLYGTDFDLTGISGSTDALKDWVDKAHEIGYHVVGSQWGKGDDPVTEAGAATYYVSQFGFDGWVMNGEKLYEGGGKSGGYVRQFRRRLPLLPLGWSPEPRLALDHAVLQQFGVAYMPQAYPLENGWNVEACVDVGVEFGYQRENIIPLVQAYRDASGTRWPAHDYAQRARFARVPALILYPGNQALDAGPEYFEELKV